MINKIVIKNRKVALKQLVCESTSNKLARKGSESFILGLVIWFCVWVWFRFYPIIFNDNMDVSVWLIV